MQKRSRCSWSPSFAVLTVTARSQAAGGADDKAPSVADSNANINELPASPAASALAQAASRQFSPELTTKIFELLCDESVSCLYVDTTVFRLTFLPFHYFSPHAKVKR